MESLGGGGIWAEVRPTAEVHQDRRNAGAAVYQGVVVGSILLPVHVTEDLPAEEQVNTAALPAECLITGPLQHCDLDKTCQGCIGFPSSSADPQGSIARQPRASETTDGGVLHARGATEKSGFAHLHVLLV